MAKFAREHRLRERRLDKQARKDARRQAVDSAAETTAAQPEPVAPSDVIAQPMAEQGRDGPTAP